MSIESINTLSEMMANQICDSFINGRHIEITYDNSNNLTGDAHSAFDHHGLYAFLLIRGNESGIVYVGKSEGDDRLRQHLTGKNKDGSNLSNSVSTKHNNIKKAISDGYNVELSLFSDDAFKKSSLSCLEIECILIGKEQIESVFGGEIASWNVRIG